MVRTNYALRDCFPEKYAEKAWTDFHEFQKVVSKELSLFVQNINTESGYLKWNRLLSKNIFHA